MPNFFMALQFGLLFAGTFPRFRFFLFSEVPRTCGLKIAACARTVRASFGITYTVHVDWEEFGTNIQRYWTLL